MPHTYIHKNINVHKNERNLVKYDKFPSNTRADLTRTGKCRGKGFQKYLHTYMHTNK